MCRHLSFWAKGWPAILKERNSFTVHNGYFNLLLVNKSLQAWSSVLNEVFLKNSIVTSKRHLSFEGLTGEWRHNNLGEDEDLKTKHWYSHSTLRTLLSLSSSFLSHSKSEYLLRTLDSFTRKTGRFVCKFNVGLKYFSDNPTYPCRHAPWAGPRSLCTSCRRHRGWSGWWRQSRES